jgi:ATP-dependent Clp protease protease subunit
VTVHIDGLAASAASFVAMAGNEILIAEGAFLMIHNAWGISVGNKDDMRRYADLLETVDGTIADVYVSRTKNGADKVKKWMDDETWFTAKEAVSSGFADKMVENLKVAAQIKLSDPNRYKHLPAALRPNTARANAALAAMGIS